MAADEKSVSTLLFGIFRTFWPWPKIKPTKLKSSNPAPDWQSVEGRKFSLQSPSLRLSYPSNRNEASQGGKGSSDAGGESFIKHRKNASLKSGPPAASWSRGKIILQVPEHN